MQALVDQPTGIKKPKGVCALRTVLVSRLYYVLHLQENCELCVQDVSTMRRSCVRIRANASTSISLKHSFGLIRHVLTVWLLYCAHRETFLHAKGSLREWRHYRGGDAFLSPRLE
jgi:hypothetical protein